VSKALSAGGEPKSYFRTSALCVLYNYVLHTPEYCTSSTGGISYFILSHLQKAELKFGGMNSNGRTNELSSSFLFSRKYLSFLYLVPTYHKYLGSTYEKPLFEMKIGQFQGGYDFCISAQIGSFNSGFPSCTKGEETLLSAPHT
jgi:hypothetical protein